MKWAALIFCLVAGLVGLGGRMTDGPLARGEGTHNGNADLRFMAPVRVRFLEVGPSRMLESLAESVRPGALEPNPANRQPTSFLPAGWSVGRQNSAVLTNGCLLIRASNDHPVVLIGELPAGQGPFGAEFRLKSDGLGRGQLFWSVGAKPAFQRTNSVIFRMVHDGVCRAYSIKLPVQAPIRFLRLDAGRAPGQIGLEFFRVKAADGRTLREWDFRQAAR